MLTFSVRDQIIDRTDGYLPVTDTVDLKARFEFEGEEWKGTITAVFSHEEESYNVILDDNHECVVPWEVIQENGVLYVSVYKVPLHPTNKAIVYVEPSGYEEGKTPSAPTPSVYEQLISTKFDDAEVQGEELVFKANAVERKRVPFHSGGGTGNVFSSDITTIKVMDKYEYDSLEYYDPKTLYLIKG